MTKKSQERISAVMQRWESGLTLTSDQKAKLLSIVTARESELQQARKENKGQDKKELKAAAIKAILKKHRPNMEALLNDQQVKQLKKLRKQWKPAKTA